MTAIDNAHDQLQVLAQGNLGAMDVLLRMHEGSLGASGLDPHTWQLVRIAALTTLDGAPVSWLTHLTMAEDLGVSPDEVLGMFVAIAPVVGTAGIVSAASKIVRAMELEDELNGADGNE